VEHEERGVHVRVYGWEKEAHVLNWKENIKFMRGRGRGYVSREGRTTLQLNESFLNK
jgi:hypothetical protein